MTPRTAGQTVPDTLFRTRHGSAWQDLSTADVFAGKRVVLFALPGAYTPTCSSSMVPRYQELLPHFQAAGVDTVACLSVNDAFVMDAWQRDQHAPGLLFLPDGNAAFTRGMGMAVDKADLGFGQRSWRYAMVVDDGVITQLFSEPQEPGDPYGASEPDTVLAWLDPSAAVTDIVLVGREGCSHCDTARGLLGDAGLPFQEIDASPRRLRALTGRTTTPQVFVDGKHIGGADDLADWLRARSAA